MTIPHVIERSSHEPRRVLSRAMKVEDGSRRLGGEKFRKTLLGMGGIAPR